MIRSDALIMPKNKTKVSAFVPENLIGQSVQVEPLTLSHYESLRHPANDAND
ncbi:hypothetical protein [Legionella qingyii]|uniref:hypothetical protein n=1 Tax=Legionella qingyii TaxID=2184757 RepID=UPI0018F711B2|nr:hypothetical protein [Legionella qingyii]